MNKSKLIFFLGLAIPALFVFRALILPGHVVWGDAPYFYPEGLKELVAEPYGWTNRGNNFGGINNFLWLYPLMFLYGVLHSIFSLENDAIIRILFYFPAILLSVVSSILFVRYLTYSKIVQFFASLLYIFNTYFLLLIDGGQVGVALAYSLFPLTLLYLRKLIDIPSIRVFSVSLIFFLLLVITDPRIAVISVFSLLIWILSETFIARKWFLIQNLRFLIPLGIAVGGISAYWIIPTLRLGELIGNLDVSRLQLLSLLNPLLLFQPHWSMNEFGRISSPPFYFIGVPLLIFGGLLFNRLKKVWVFAFLVLVFAFLVKGETPPLGWWYGWLVNHFPFGIAFRDSTKFFAPLLLFAGVLSGVTIEQLARGVTLLHKSVTFPFRLLVIVIPYFYFLFLIYPALQGKLNWVLSSKIPTNDFQKIYTHLKDKDGFFKTAWFPERNPLAFQTEEKPALDANLLVDERPFASLNVGTFDRFNFVHDSQFLDWFDLLGIKYLIFTGNQRQTILDEGQKKDWDDLLELVGNSKGLEKIDWGTTFPIFKIPEVKPRIFAVDKLIVVIGGDDIYGKLKKADPNFSVGNQGFIFLEDGKSDPKYLEGIVPESAILVFNNEKEMDFTMSFLRRFFISPLGATKGIRGPSQWAIRSSSEYLRWKYELLVNGVNTKEFDYDKGIAFSSVPDEWIYFNLNVPEDGEYVFAARVLAKNKDEILEANTFYGVQIPFNTQGQFEWYWQEATFLKKGTKKVAFKNVSGFHALNTLALIPKKDWDNAQKISRELIGRFQTVNLDSTGVATLADLLRNGSWHKVDYQEISQTRYKILGFRKDQWVVFTDSYHPKWDLEDGGDSPSYPFYSMVNGFYTSKPGEAEIVFSGQKDVRLAMTISLVSILAILASFGIISWRKKNA